MDLWNIKNQIRQKIKDLKSKINYHSINSDIHMVIIDLNIGLYVWIHNLS